MHLQKASPSRLISKALKTRAAHDLAHEFEKNKKKKKTFLGPEHKKTTGSLSQMKLRLDTSQMTGGQCECGAWDLVEDLDICVSSS